MSCQCMSREGLGEHVSHHLVSGEVPQLDGSLLHVVLEEVPFQTDVLDVKLADLKVAGGCDGQEETHAGHADDRGERLCVI